MSALIDAAAYARDPALVDPLTAAVVQAAMAISYEDPTTDGHEQRKRLATQVLANPAGAFAVFAWATSTNGTVVGKWVGGDTDGALGDLGFVLGSVWDAVAGV